MTRRRIALLCLLAGALLGALSPWTIHSERVVTALARQIDLNYGVKLTSSGGLSFTLLPMPQLVLTGVQLASADGSVTVKAKELRTQLRLLPIFSRRLRLYKFWLVESHVAIKVDNGDSPSVAGILKRLRERIGTEETTPWIPRIDRFLLTDSEIGLLDGRNHEFARLRKVSLLLSSSEPDGELTLTSSGQWNDETAILSLSGLNLAAITGGRPQAVEGELSGGMGRVSLAGSFTWAEKPRFAGSIHARTASFARLARWSGLALDLGDIDKPGSISSEGSIDLDTVQCPRATIDIGNDRVYGALAVQFGARPQVRATLAGDELDLGWIGRLVEPKGPDRLHADYDVRLSATELALGSAHLRDAALSIQSSARAIEVSLGRATLASGTVRGRVVALLEGEGRDLRAMGWVDGINLDKALGDIAGIRGLSGTATGQFNVEITGDRSEPLARQLRGRGTIQARQGEIGGAILADAARRHPQGPIPTDWRSGRTKFGEARVTLDFTGGRAELSNSALESGSARYQVSGQVDMQSLVASLRLTPQQVGSSPIPVTLDLTGPLGSLNVSAVATDAPLGP